MLVLNLDTFSVNTILDNKANILTKMSLESIGMTVLKPGLRSHSIAFFGIKDIKAEVEKKECLNAFFETTLVANYYNLGVGAWEPLLEEWSFKILAK